MTSQVADSHRPNTGSVPHQLYDLELTIAELQHPCQ